MNRWGFVCSLLGVLVVYRLDNNRLDASRVVAGAKNAVSEGAISIRTYQQLMSEVRSGRICPAHAELARDLADNLGRSPAYLTRPMCQDQFMRLAQGVEYRHCRHHHGDGAWAGGRYADARYPLPEWRRAELGRYRDYGEAQRISGRRALQFAVGAAALFGAVGVLSNT